jgi:hypothetical protein
MKFLTSIGPSRTARQQKCIQSWIANGGNVTAVQARSDEPNLMMLENYFPDVEFVFTDLVGDLFGKPYMPRIAAFFPFVTEPSILINSDIEVSGCKDGEFDRLWEPVDGLFKVGVRWDHNSRKTRMLPQKWGLDAFLLTPEIVSKTPDIGMTIGVPCWDYWLPWHCVTQLGLTVQPVFDMKRRMLMHEWHQQNWSKEDHKRAMDVLEPVVGMAGAEMDKLIQVWTGRTLWRNR